MTVFALLISGWAVLMACSETDDGSGTGSGDGGNGAATSTGAGGSGGVPAMGGFGGEPIECLDYGDMSLYQTTPVSFSLDVVPVLQASCNGDGSNCHASTAAQPKAGLALGPRDTFVPTPMEIDAVHAELVGVAAQKSTMVLVRPSDPAHSFLLSKVEYRRPDACLPDGEMCLGTGCGNDMPAGQSAVPLTETEKSLLRTWIRDGALND